MIDKVSNKEAFYNNPFKRLVVSQFNRSESYLTFEYLFDEIYSLQNNMHKVLRILLSYESYKVMFQ